MGLFQLRPSFTFAVDCSRDESIRRLKLEFERFGSPQLFFMHGEYGELHLPTQEHRLWSPHLSFYVSDPTDDSLTPVSGEANSQTQTGCTIRGLFAPRVDVWTFVWILYLSFAFTVFFALIFAYVQWMLNHSLSGLWIAVLAAIAWLALNLIAKIGQQWSADQMETLRDRLNSHLANAGIEKRGT